MQTITEAVSLERRGTIGILWIDNPPVNALGYPVRKGLADGMHAANNDDTIRAIVIICRGRTFCAGADIREMGKPPVEPHLPDVLNRIDSGDKPVIAALHGTALGGGMELALACHYRIAASTARMGLPEVKLGLLPAAGGTQRLPRLIGPEKALKMILSGDPIDAPMALAEGVIDAVVADDLAEAAVAFANRVLEEKKPLVRVSAMTEKIEAFRNNTEFFNNFRRQVAERSRGFEAPMSCIQAVEAAMNLPFADGSKLERELFMKLRGGTQSAAQRYYFFAQRQTAKIPDIDKNTPATKIRTAGVVVGDNEGCKVAMHLIRAGIPVTLFASGQALLERARASIRDTFTKAAQKGEMDTAEIDACLDRITVTTDLTGIGAVDLIVEATGEEMAATQKLFSQLDAVSKPGTILATTSSQINIEEVAALTQNPECILGLHFSGPADDTLALIEIVRTKKTAKPVLAAALALAKTMKSIPVVVGACNGCAADRMYARFKRSCERLLLEGALPSQVDNALYEFGFPMGPFAAEDSSSIKFLEKQGSVLRKIEDEEIIERCIYPVINECASIMEEKIVLRPSDLDVIWIQAYGWPLYRGGPTFYADAVGVDRILERLQAFREQFGDDVEPAPLLARLAKEGKNFGSLN